jgi:hypothetical protein
VLTRQQRRAASGTLAAHEIDFLLGVRRPREEIARLRADGIAYKPLYRDQRGQTGSGTPVAVFSCQRAVS